MSTTDPQAAASSAIAAALTTTLRDMTPLTSATGTHWIGFSGGVDSTALLLGLAALRESYAIDLRGIHVNHGISAHAAAWARHSADICHRYDVPLTLCEVVVSRQGNMEANAREARFACFSEHMADEDTLWLAHHRDDQFETVLLRLLQGRGLIQMRNVARLGSLRVARPLLTLPKTLLVEFVQAQEVRWIEDESNTELTYDRNFLRHEITPLLSARWPDVATRVTGVSARAEDIRQAFRTTLVNLPNPGVDAIPAETGQAAAWLHVFLESRGCYSASGKAIAEFQRQLEQGDKARVAFADGSSLLVRRGMLVYVPA